MSKTTLSRTAAVASLLFALGYTVSVFSGWIVKDNRIDVVHLGLIGLSIIAAFLCFFPDLLQDLKIFEFGSLKVEFEKVKETQKKQEEFLNDLRILLPLILPNNEINHLKNLANGDTQEYEGGGTLRGEIRRLRSRDLIEMRDGMSASDMVGGIKFDLGHYVTITKLGRQWLERAQQLAQQEAAIAE